MSVSLCWSLGWKRAFLFSSHWREKFPLNSFSPGLHSLHTHNPHPRIREGARRAFRFAKSRILCIRVYSVSTGFGLLNIIKSYMNRQTPNVQKKTEVTAPKSINETYCSDPEAHITNEKKIPCFCGIVGSKHSWQWKQIAGNYHLHPFLFSNSYFFISLSLLFVLLTRTSVEAFFVFEFVFFVSKIIIENLCENALLIKWNDLYFPSSHCASQTLAIDEVDRLGFFLRRC